MFDTKIFAISIPRNSVQWMNGLSWCYLFFCSRLNQLVTASFIMKEGIKLWNIQKPLIFEQRRRKQNSGNEILRPHESNQRWPRDTNKGGNSAASFIEWSLSNQENKVILIAHFYNYVEISYIFFLDFGKPAIRFSRCLSTLYLLWVSNNSLIHWMVTV